MGMTQAPFYPVTGGALTCNWFPVSGWALPSSLGNVGLTLGAAATGPLIAWLMVRFGWRMSFVLTAPIAFLLAAVWWWYVRDRPAEHRSVRPAERAWIDRDRPATLCEPCAPGSARQVLRDPQVLLLAASYFCSNYVFYFFFNWLYIYLVEHRGLKVLEGAALRAVPWISGAVGALARRPRLRLGLAASGKADRAPRVRRSGPRVVGRDAPRRRVRRRLRRRRRFSLPLSGIPADDRRRVSGPPPSRFRASTRRRPAVS